MSLNLRESIEALKTEIVGIANDVLRIYIDATTMFLSLNTEGAQAISDKRAKIEGRSAAFEDHCNKVLALHQPVAKDLRKILNYFKLGSDLERLGSLSARISKKALRIPSGNSSEIVGTFNEQVEKVELMLENCIVMIKSPTPETALKISASNVEIRASRKDFRDKLEAQIIESKEQAGMLINTLGVFRHLVRIADLTADIANDFVEV